MDTIMLVLGPNRISLADATIFRLVSKISVLPNGCWKWMGGTYGAGYGKIKIRAISPNGEEVHRICYQMVNGPIDSSVHLHHKVEDGCIGPRCGNPGHLQATDAAEHALHLTPRSAAYINSRRDSCAAGHPYTIKNLRLRKDGTRVCRECCKIAQQAFRDANKGGIPPSHAKDPTKLNTHCKRGHAMEGENIHWIYPKPGSPSPPQRSCHACEKVRAEEYSEKQRRIKAGEIPAPEPRSKTHCKRGHPLSGENVHHNANGRGKICRTCHNEAARRHHAVKVEKRSEAFLTSTGLKGKLTTAIAEGASSAELAALIKSVLK